MKRFQRKESRFYSCDLNGKEKILSKVLTDLHFRKIALKYQMENRL